MFPTALVANLCSVPCKTLHVGGPVVVLFLPPFSRDPITDRRSEFFVNVHSVEMKDSRRRSRSPKYGGSAGGSDWYDSNGRNSSAMGDGHEEGYRLHVADLHTKGRIEIIKSSLTFSQVTIQLNHARDPEAFEPIACFWFRPPKGTSRRPLASSDLSERFGWRGRLPASPSLCISTRTTRRRPARWPTALIFKPGTYFAIVCAYSSQLLLKLTIYMDILNAASVLTI